MGRRVQHKCDGCGSLLDPEKGIVKDKELTIEQVGGGKVSILISVDNMSDDEETYDHPALCCACLLSSVKHWCETGLNFRREQ